MIRRFAPAVVVLCLAARAQGAAPNVDACASASESAQSLRLKHELRAAREKLLVCTDVACPAPIRRDCDDLLAQVDAAMPTVVLVAHDGKGRDLTDVHVTLDGKPFVDALDGDAHAVDPGAHTLRFEREGIVVEQSIVAHESEKDRRVVVQLGPTETPVVPPAPPTTTSATSSSATAGWVLAGVGVVALGAWGYVALSGQSDYDRCRQQGCSDSEVDALSRKRWIGWTALGIGVGASIAATWVLIGSGEPTKGPSTQLGVAAQDGPVLRWSGTF